MIQCQNCGQVNNYGSNFCRFCGTRMVINQPVNQPQQQQQNQNPHEYNAPRPYVWKTDEFQVSDAAERKQRQINQVQPLSNFQMQNQRPAQPMQMTYPTPQPMMPYGYRCPRCGTQNFPHISRKISTAGWIVFAVLLVMFFPLFWIGLLIKEDVKICPVCNTTVA